MNFVFIYFRFASGFVASKLSAPPMFQCWQPATNTLLTNYIRKARIFEQQNKWHSLLLMMAFAWAQSLFIKWALSVSFSQLNAVVCQHYIFNAQISRRTQSKAQCTRSVCNKISVVTQGNRWRTGATQCHFSYFIMMQCQRAVPRRTHTQAIFGC